MPLTDAECRNAVCPPYKKQARVADSGGMYLQVSPAGSKRWFLKYRVDGKEKQLAIGSYPEVSLNAARKARDAAKLKASTPAANTFKATALEWYDIKLES